MGQSSDGTYENGRPLPGKGRRHQFGRNDGTLSKQSTNFEAREGKTKGGKPWLCECGRHYRQQTKRMIIFATPRKPFSPKSMPLKEIGESTCFAAMLRM